MRSVKAESTDKMIKLESCHSNVANFPQVLPKWVIGRKETVTKRGQTWFSHPLSADLESELYKDTGIISE